MIDRAFIKLLAAQIDLQGKCGRVVGGLSEKAGLEGGGEIWVVFFCFKREMNPENTSSVSVATFP